MGRDYLCRFDATRAKSTFCRNSLPAIALGLATCFSAGQANAQSAPCPGVTVTTYPTLFAFQFGSPSSSACGANTGAITANGLSSDSEVAIDERRKRKQRRLVGSGRL